MITAVLLWMGLVALMAWTLGRLSSREQGRMGRSTDDLGHADEHTPPYFLG